MNHTPGPWATFSDAEIRTLTIMRPTRSGEIATVQFPTIEDAAKDAECEANACLIAAAPDMLAALIKTSDNLSGLSQSDDDIFAAMNRRVRAAIVKATGGTK